MKKFLCIQRSRPGSGKEPSPSEMEKMYAQFGAWMTKFQKNIVDLGGRLGAGKHVRSDDATDGPFVEAKEVIGGYMIVTAASLKEAISVARECPGLVSPGSSVEVREIHTPQGK